MTLRRTSIAAAIITAGVVLAACSDGGSASGPTTSAAASVATSTAAATSGPSGLSISSILGDTLPTPPPGTTWTRIADDGGTFSFEVPSAWADHRSVAWNVAGTRVGTLVVAGPVVSKVGTDFTAPGVIVGIAASAAGSTPRAIVEADDFSASCAGEPVEEASEAGYTTAFKAWSRCGGNADAFLLVIAIAPADSAGLIAVVLQGVQQSDLGYLERIIGSLQASGVTPTTAPGPSSPGTGQTYTITVDQCLLQLSDVFAIGVIRNTDTSSHAYLIRVRFSDQAGVVIAEGERETPALAPGEAFRYQTPNKSATGATGATCTVVAVEVFG